MIFSSVTFIFLFLPLALAAYYVLPRALRNAWLVLASLLFYSWSGFENTGILAFSILLNWACGLAMGKGSRAKAVLALGVCANLTLLFAFKYAPASLLSLALPLGISFYTFHAISYLVDIRRGLAEPFRNPVNLALYMVFFPQLIAGPITRYAEIAPQILGRRESLARMVSGIERFIQGLAKKVLLADSLAPLADHAFSLEAGKLNAGQAWLGLACYTLQIYYDFSGYSDMAVGLGRFFGFELPENFRFPYAADSVRDFWRRWHMSLTRWFRDYLYIPLGGNKGSAFSTARNLVLVFFLCALWHGPQLHFLAWGLLHGAFLALERTGFGTWLERAPKALRHAYVLLSVMLAWVFFRAESLPGAIDYLQALLGLRGGDGFAEGFALYGSTRLYAALAAAILFAIPLRWSLPRIPRLVAAQALFLVALAYVSVSTYKPFIYFQF